MKKFFSMMVAVAAMFTFAACGGDDAENKPSHNNGGNNNGGNNNGGGQLETPVAKAENITEDGFTLVWEAVANAAGYEIRMNNQTYSTEETSYVFEGLNKGTYKAYVMAKGSGNYTDSEY